MENKKPLSIFHPAPWKNVGRGPAFSHIPTALRAARPSPDVNELLLEELAATRYMLLNLFHATAQAGDEGRALAPESVVRIRETADARKREQARKLLGEFLANTTGNGSGKGAAR